METENMNELKLIMRRIKFHGPMVRIDLERLDRQIFDKWYNLKGQGGYAKQMKEELVRQGINDEIDQNRVTSENKSKILITMKYYYCYRWLHCLIEETL